MYLDTSDVYFNLRISNGLMWNLKDGTYEVTFRSIVGTGTKSGYDSWRANLDNIGPMSSAVTGRKWMIRAISPKISSFEKIN